MVRAIICPVFYCKAVTQSGEKVVFDTSTKEGESDCSRFDKCLLIKNSNWTPHVFSHLPRDVSKLLCVQSIYFGGNGLCYTRPWTVRSYKYYTL